MDREVGPGRGVFLSRYDHAKHLENKVITVICGYPIEKSCGFFLSFALLSFSLYRVLPRNAPVPIENLTFSILRNKPILGWEKNHGSEKKNQTPFELNQAL